MTIAPPGGHGEVFQVRHLVLKTTRNDLLIFISESLSTSTGQFDHQFRSPSSRL